MTTSTKCKSLKAGVLRWCSSMMSSSPWATGQKLVFLLLFAFFTGCGGESSSPGRHGNQPATIAFNSNRALDGSDAANANPTDNIWTVKADGSGPTPLTRLTASGVFNVGHVWSPDGSKIAFYSNRALDGSDTANGAYNIWVMKSDGSGAAPLTRLLTSGTSGDNPPVWAPDGRKLAFESDRALDGSDATINVSNIWVANADGSGAAPLTKSMAVGADSFVPAWSPDGSKLAFASRRALNGSDAENANSTTNIWLMNADGSGATPLTKLTAANAGSGDPFWSPDGSKLVFDSSRSLNGNNASNTNNTTNIWVMKPDGSGAVPLTKSMAVSADSFSAAWSPDGRKLAFVSDRALDGSDSANINTTFNIWVVNADGSGAAPLTKITAPGASSGDPAWSLDGSKVAFDSMRSLDNSDAVNINGTRNAWVVNADGSGATPLTRITANHADSGGDDGSGPTWSP